MTPLHAVAYLMIAIALVIVFAAVVAHLEYRQRFPVARGIELDRLGMCWDCPRVDGERDRHYRRRLRDHVAHRHTGRAAGAR